MRELLRWFRWALGNEVGAYAINVKSIVPPTEPVAWEKRIQLADVSADPAVQDLGKAAFWFVLVKLVIKASNNTVDARLVTTDDVGGITNPREIAKMDQVTSATLGTRHLSGWTDKLQEFLTIDLTLGGTATIDIDIFATPLT